MRQRTRARRLGGLIAGLLIIGFLLWGVARGWDTVSDYEWSVEPGLLAAAIAALLAFYLVAGLGYVWLIERLGGPGRRDASPRPSRLAVLSVWARSLLGRYVPGNVLMVTGRVVLGREAGVPARVTLAASVYEQTLSLVTAAIASLVFLAGYEAPGGVPWVLLAAGVVAGLLLLHPRVFGPLSAWALAKLGREPLGESLSGSELAGLFAYYGAANLLLGAGVWLLVRSFAGAEAGSLDYVGLAFLVSFVAGMIAFVFPSGLGVRDATFALALSANLPGSVAVATSAIVRLALTVVEVAFVGAALAAPRLAARAREEGGARGRRLRELDD